MGTATFHCERAWLGGEHVEPDVRIDVADGVIVAVAPGSDPPPDATHLGGVTLPGFANAHSHAFHRALRGRTQSGAGTFWTWREDMYQLAATLEPDSYRALARAAYAEMVLAGITCVGEFHYVHHDPDGVPYADPNEMGLSLLQAAADAGLRITLLDTCYLGSGLDAERGLLPPVGAQERFSDGDAESWIRRVEQLLPRAGARARIGAAIHSVRAVDPRAIESVAAWASARRCPLHAHVSEQPAENEQCHHAYNRSPIGLLADCGALGRRFTAVHATHVTDHDVTQLAGAGAFVCMCPTTERDLADGIGPAPTFRSAGVSLSLGSDSHAVIDMFEEARAVELDARLATGRRGTFATSELLAAATVAGHECLGWSDAGRIATGWRADLVSVDLGSVRTAGTVDEHVLAAAVFAAGAADVTDVVIDGEHVVRDGAHRRIDVAAELASAIGSVWEAAG